LEKKEGTNPKMRGDMKGEWKGGEKGK